MKPEELPSYEALADPKWKGRVLQRPGKAQYNISLVASLVERDGADKAAAHVKSMVANFAREAAGNDSTQARDILAGRGDVSFINTYYLGCMLTGGKEDEKAAVQTMGVFFPEKTHTNVAVAPPPPTPFQQGRRGRVPRLPAPSKSRAGSPGPASSIPSQPAPRSPTS